MIRTVFAKVCILFLFYIPIKLLMIAIVKIVLCSGSLEKLGNFQKKFNNVYSPSVPFLFQANNQVPPNTAPRGGVLGNVLSL